MCMPTHQCRSTCTQLLCFGNPTHHGNFQSQQYLSKISLYLVILAKFYYEFDLVSSEKSPKPVVPSTNNINMGLRPTTNTHKKNSEVDFCPYLCFCTIVDMQSKEFDGCLQVGHE